MEKKKARRAGRDRLGALTASDQAAKSALILKNLENLPELGQARVIMAFAPLPGEVDLSELWRQLMARGVTVTFPVLAGEDGAMDAVEVRDLARDLKAGKFGILQPSQGSAIDPARIDIVFVPALAYDLRGHRLGRGGGYYDRFLSTRAPRAFRCGVGFECQIVSEVPIKEHDCPIHAVVTEVGVRRHDRARNCLSGAARSTI